MSIEKHGSKLDEVIEFLQVFKSLIILDNLETINSSEIRELLRQVPQGSKILITSRVGMGEFEERYPVSPLSVAAASELLREMTRLLNVTSLSKTSNADLAKLVDELYCNPLAIRWFVGAVANGSTPDLVLKSRSDLLKYCFKNIVERLPAHSMQIINAFQLARRPLTYAELAYFCPNVDVITALNELLQTSIVRPVTSRTTKKPIFALGDFATDYMRAEYPPSPEAYRQFVTLNSMAGHGNYGRSNKGSKYKPSAIVLDESDRDSGIAALYLKQAMIHARCDRRDEAFESIEKARTCSPEVAEVYRIGAWVAQQFGDYFRAEEFFEIALELGEQQAHIHAAFSNFCIDVLKDYHRGYNSAKIAVELDRCAATLFCLARAARSIGDIETALNSIDFILRDEDKLNVFYHRAGYTLGVSVCQIALSESLHGERLPWMTKALEFARASIAAGFTDQQFVNASRRILFYFADAIIPELSVDERTQAVELLVNNESLLMEWCPSAYDVCLDRLVTAGQRGQLSIVDFSPISGIVIHYDPRRGFGKIKAGSGDEFFFHRSCVAGDINDLKLQGQAVRIIAADAAVSGKARVARKIATGNLSP